MRIRVAVIGGGSWGTTVASLAAGRHPTVLWARKPEVAHEINEDHTNSTYLAGCVLPPKLTATSDLEKAVAQAELLIVGVPSHGFRETLVMDSVFDALVGSEEPFFRGLRFGPLTETPVKNVGAKK